MRTIISTLTGLSLLAAIFLSGGASLSFEEATPPQAATPLEAATPLALDAPFSKTADPSSVRDALQPVRVATRLPLPANIDPQVDQPLNEWFGCAPPSLGSICILRPTGVETLVPDEPAQLEDWRPLVELFFDEADVELAMEVMACESRGDRWAKNPLSTASGLFQHLASLWPPRAAAAGYAGADVFDPVANVAVAAWLVNDGGGWRHWNASRHCWR